MNTQICLRILGLCAWFIGHWNGDKTSFGPLQFPTKFSVKEEQIFNSAFVTFAK